MNLNNYHLPTENHMKNNIFLFHLDNEIHKLFGLNNTYRQEQIYEACMMVTKVAFLLCEDCVYVPASNYFEADVSFDVLNGLKIDNLVGAECFRLISSSYSLEELLQKKRIQHGEELGAIGYHYIDFLQNEARSYLPGMLTKRKNSASADIEKAWMSGEGIEELAEIIYTKLPGRFSANQLEIIISEIPERLGEKAYISQYITPYFRPSELDKVKLDNIINCFITREYIRSFLDEFHAVCMTNIPLFNASLVLPDGAEYRHLSYSDYEKALRISKYKGKNAYKYVEKVDFMRLYEFKYSEVWKDICNNIEAAREEPSFNDSNIICRADISKPDSANSLQLVTVPRNIINSKGNRIMSELDKKVDDNLRSFWEKRGKTVVEAYRNELATPVGKLIQLDRLNEKLDKCKVLILTANYVEGTIVSRCLMKHNGVEKLERITADKHIYQFSEIKGVPIVHIWPQGTSSFTVHGSFRALVAAFKRFQPKYVFSIGVAFGANPDKQELGDVVVSDHLVFYDSFNKITDGTMTLSADEVQMVGEDILAGCPFLKKKDQPLLVNIGDFKWYLGNLLSGGTVLSDQNEKQRLIGAAESLGHEIIGGEMEGSGVYFACNGVDHNIPFIVVKGICDWAVNKNGWGFVKEYENETIKDCVQALACENAFNAISYIIEHGITP